MMNRILGLSLAGIMALTANAWADSTASVPASATPSSSSSTSEFFGKVRKNLRGTYQNWFRGSTIRTLSGNTDGSGTNLLMTHYAALGYKLGSKWSMSMTQPFTQAIDEQPATSVDPFVAGDPYVTFTNSRVLHSDKYGTNLYTYLRYYAPFSRATNRNMNAASVNDAGRGQVRLYLSPTKTFLDGAVTLNLQTLFQYRIAARNNAERTLANGEPYRNDLVFIFDPVLSWAPNETYEWYIEYAFDMTHNTKGNILSKWTKWKANDYFSPGVNIMVTKKLLVNPYLEITPKAKEFKNMGIGSNIVYYFL